MVCKLVAILALMMVPFPVVGADEQENIVKAAYIRSALNFAEWPRGSYPVGSGHFRLGIAGKSREIEKQYRIAFEKLGHRILNRSVEILSFDSPDKLSDYLGQPESSCHALFVPASEASRSKEWIQAAGKRPIPLFSDDPEFISNGGDAMLIPYPTSPGRFQYHIHTNRLKAKKIRFNSGFLRLRTTVKVVSGTP